MLDNDNEEQIIKVFKRWAIFQWIMKMDFIVSNIYITKTERYQIFDVIIEIDIITNIIVNICFCQVMGTISTFRDLKIE